MTTALAIDLQDHDRRELAEIVAAQVDAVRRRGDDALRVPGRPAAPLRLAGAELERLVQEVPAGARGDLRLIQEQTRRVAIAQRAAIVDFEREAPHGTRVGARHVPVTTAGICLPDVDQGGVLSAAPAGAIAARVAGVRTIVACVPAATGRPSPLLVAALVAAGVDQIYCCGGPTAFTALRFGTDSIPRVDVVYAVGDRALEETDRQIEAILSDQPAGRGLLIIADDAADADLVAADLIAAGECGADARGVLISTSPGLGARVASSVERQLAAMRDGDPVRAAWRHRGAIHIVGDREEACLLADRHAFARVEVMARDPRWYLNRLQRCSVVLLGACAGIALADVRARRPPGAAWDSAANSVGAFLRQISYSETDRCAEGASFARYRRAAGLEAHARACELRALRRSHAPRETPRTAVLPFV